MQEHDFRWVAKTAYGVAYARTFSDITLAQEVLPKLRAIVGPESAEQEKYMLPGLIPYFEARYLLVNRMLEKLRIKQVLDVGSGMSFRGAEMTNDPSVTYAELDQPAMMTLKEDVMKGIGDGSVALERCMSRRNWHRKAGDALDRRSLSAALMNFRDPKKPVAFVNEGLLQYFNHQTKNAYAKHILSFRRRHPIIWITPDIWIKNSLSEIPGHKEMERQWFRSVKRDLSPNAFKDESEARLFYWDAGFVPESHSFAEVFDEMVSFGRLRLPVKKYQRILSRHVLFVMRPR